MKKPSNKPKGKKPTKDAYTVTEVGTLIEELRGEFRTFGERQKGIIDKLDKTYKQVARNTERITLLEIAIRDLAAKIKALTKSIDSLIKTKLDREEFHALEKRVEILENKVASLSQ